MLELLYGIAIGAAIAGVICFISVMWLLAKLGLLLDTAYDIGYREALKNITRIDEPTKKQHDHVVV